MTTGVAAWIATHFAPYPLAMVIPAWMLGRAAFGNIDAGPKLIPLLGALPFLLVGIPLLTAKTRTVWPSVAFISLLVLGSVAYFAVAWDDGFKYQGSTYTVLVAGINAVFAGISLELGFLAFQVRTYARRYFAAWVPCLWFASCALPWLGEMP
jgi:hypothetical protein